MRISSFRARASRAVRWHRRGLAALSAGCCVLLCLTVLSPRAPATTPVIVAAHDLPAGAALTAADLRVAHFPDDLAPSQAVADAAPLVGRVLGAPVTRGTPVTGLSTVSSSGNARPGELLVGLHLADATLLPMVRVGDRITVVSAGQDGQVVTLAARVRVAALPQGSTGQGSSLSADTPDGGQVVVAADPGTAGRLAAYSTGQSLSIALG